MNNIAVVLFLALGTFFMGVDVGESRRTGGDESLQTQCQASLPKDRKCVMVYVIEEDNL